ncbi:putative signal peptide protein [Acidisarcina polymorpha]|uniref:Putative signal peptide protein n=1 Tax=Acidisarcina polymorpha TaxID=2211140 RepID=A0A2Z5G4Q5_9BACT|nr:alpha/beta hydrolase [Acidisarcina polymorpha]AXC13506.1 putative signal peptide protein [Acidisarcina polymorpha]
MFRRIAGLTVLMGMVALLGTQSSQAQKPTVKNIILVHGAWADGSGWQGIYDILVKEGFKISIVQEPETTFQDDVTAVQRVLALQDGRSILVAHSYGGAVVTESGNDPSVAGLVYVAAHMLEAGESEAGEGKLFPSALSKSTALKTTTDGFTYLDPSQFHAYFAADLPADKAAFMANSRVLNLAVSFKAVITKAAWTTKPSWMVVAGADRTINPNLERFYAKRANDRAGSSHSIALNQSL